MWSSWGTLLETLPYRAVTPRGMTQKWCQNRTLLPQHLSKDSRLLPVGSSVQGPDTVAEPPPVAFRALGQSVPPSWLTSNSPLTLKVGEKMWRARLGQGIHRVTCFYPGPFKHCWWRENHTLFGNGVLDPSWCAGLELSLGHLKSTEMGWKGPGSMIWYSAAVPLCSCMPFPCFCHSSEGLKLGN